MSKFKSVLKWIFESFVWLGVLILVIDIVTKNVIIHYGIKIMAEGGIVLIPGFLRISYIVNENIAFGISLGTPQITQIVFSIVALVIVGVIIFFLVRKWGKINKFYRACAMLIIAGAIGNVIDRLCYSPEYLYTGGTGPTGVVDWIDFYGIWKYTFNIADSAVVVAAFMLIIYMIVDEIKIYIKNKPEREAKKQQENNEKVLSKTEQEKQQLLEESKEDNDSEVSNN